MLGNGNKRQQFKVVKTLIGIEQTSGQSKKSQNVTRIKLTDFRHIANELANNSKRDE